MAAPSAATSPLTRRGRGLGALLAAWRDDPPAGAAAQLLRDPAERNHLDEQPPPGGERSGPEHGAVLALVPDVVQLLQAPAQILDGLDEQGGIPLLAHLPPRRLRSWLPLVASTTTAQV